MLWEALLDDPLPPLKPGVLRLYSMKFCPFAERARLVLAAKEIDHEVINVNIWNKPTWFGEKNPLQTVPVLEQDQKILYESLIVAAYLDELYPNKNPLIPKDPYLKARDDMLIDFHGNKVLSPFFGANGGADAEKMTALRAGLEKEEAELKKRGTNYFHGDKPGFVDYMIWPMFARVPSSGVFGEGQGIPDTFTALSAWVKRMLKDKAVLSTLHPDDAYAEIIKYYRKDPTVFDRVDTPN